MEKRVEELVNAYIYSLSCLETKELFMANLPNLFFDSANDIINALINYFLFELNTAEDMLKESISEEEKLILNDEILLINNKINWCNEKLSEKLHLDAEEKMLEESPNINIVFAKKNGSNITYFEDDLEKDIPKEYYKDVFECLDRFKKFGFNENKERQKMISSVDKTLKGICELKSYQIRIIYKVLDKNTIYITQLYVKKDDKSLRIKESMINRDARIRDAFLDIKSRISNSDYKKQLIDDSELIINRILETYSKNIKGEGTFAKN